MVKVNKRILVEKSSNGDIKSFEKLFNALYSDIYRKVYLRTLNSQITAEITLEIFKNLAINIHKYKWKNTKAFDRFIYKLYKSEINNYFSRSRNYRPIEAGEFLNAHKIKGISLKQIKFLKIFVSLKPFEQEVLFNKYFLNLTDGKIADLESRSIKKIKKIHSNSISKLAEICSNSDELNKAIKDEADLIKYLKFFEKPSDDSAKNKAKIKNYCVGVFEDYKINKSRYRLVIKPIYIAIALPILIVTGGAIAYFGYLNRPLNPQLVLNRSISYYARLDNERPNKYYYTEDHFTQNNDDEQIIRYNKVWDDMESSNYIAETTDESGEILLKAIRQDDQLYVSENLDDVADDQQILNSPTITEEDLNTKSYSQIDQELIKDGQAPYFKELYGTDDFPGYRMHPDQVLILSDEEFKEAFPGIIIPTDEEIKTEQNYYRISEQLMNSPDINQRSSLLGELRQLNYLKLTEERIFNNQKVIGIDFEGKLVSESDKIISYFSVDDWRYVGSEAYSKKLNSTINATNKVINEFYISYEPNFDTTGLTLQEYEGFSSDNLSGELAYYQNDRLGISFNYPVEWGNLVEKPLYFDERGDDFITLEPSFYINISIDAATAVGAGYQEVPEGSMGYEKRGEWYFDRANKELRLDDVGTATEKQNLYKTKYLQVKLDNDSIDLPENQSIQTVSVNLENSIEFDGFAISYWGSADATDLEILLSSLRTDLDQR